MGADVITLGCRLNIAESEAMRELNADADDLIIINSCAVTAEAVKQARQAIRRARRARPEALIVVTGCAAQTEPETFAAMTEVDRVIGNVEKALHSSFAFPFVPSAVEGRDEGQKRVSTSLDTNGFFFDSERVKVSDIMAVRENAPHMASAFADHARAFVEVQNGCDHRCTFCIIPYGRGNSRSVPAGAVIDRIKALVDAGYQEIVLTGVDVTSYGADLPGAPNLGMLVERIIKHVPALPRLRLSSIDSVEIDDRLFELLTGEPRVMPHLHLSLQAGDDMILRRMKRRHSRADAIRIVERLKAKRPEIAIGADLIAGFPTEDDVMAANSLAMIDECDIVFGHIFPYSPRKGTPAARMPQVAPVAIKDRAKALREATARRRAAWLESLVGSTQRVLIERGGLKGHAENFATVEYSCERRNPVAESDMDSCVRRNTGEIVPVTVIAVSGDTLIGVPA
jgi:threonylcarbamoyladenosine tRNA methylthiotransferase MtaB